MARLRLSARDQRRRHDRARSLGHKTPKMALYYCRLANQKLLAEQAADILDLAFAKRAEGREGRVAARRNQIKRVK